jgi:hypothetical protein
MTDPAVAVGGRWATMRSARRCFWPITGVAFALYVFNAVGETFAWGWLLDLGSMSTPDPAEMMFFLSWATLGSLAAGLLVVALTQPLRHAVGCLVELDGIGPGR